MSMLPNPLMEDASMPPSDVYKTAGPLLVGSFLNFMLYGVLCNQVYIYYISFPKDRLMSKSIVRVLWLTETVQTIINITGIFDTFCYKFGNLSALNDIGLSWFGVPILSGFVGCVCQLFYAWRMYNFSKKAQWLSITLSMIACMQFSGAIISGVGARRYDHSLELQTDLKVKVATAIWLGGSALCDVAIALCMTYILSRANTGLKSTRILISRLIRLSIETGSITATLAVVCIALFLAYPNDNYYTSPAVCLVKVYSNTVLAVCNSRMTRRIRGGREDVTLHTYEFDLFDLSNGELDVELQNVQTNMNAESPLPLECPQGSEGNRKIPYGSFSDAKDVLGTKPT
ncbi:uncharacterized protein EV420DRAFT_1572857 [Desarmillaria tabescens]|uniref:DUF6534 domain-containing protein n=1 Tax=Armillaria tabescens TaxID=1929756 RepID=A0AA39MS18_ARMTA|nr:uncharacterized protein EV420DRAFT_1572857 [Desarmillaria tabescens]KAK0444991.1 hypothetical protein EV420DRAFT_1572857 [Desarmillaria tabescens]